MSNKINFGGFEQLSSMINPSYDKDTFSKYDDRVDDEEEKEDENEEEILQEEKENEEIDQEENDDEEEKEDENEEDDKNEEEKDDFTDVEIKEISSFFSNKLLEELGIDSKVFLKENKIEKFEDVINLMSDIVKENSKPIFANEEVEKYNDFVKNGGKLKDFYKELYEGKVDINNVDLETEEDQKIIVREHLKNIGYSDKKIESAVKRYEDAGILKEQADEFLDLIKDNNEKKEQKLLEEKKKESKDNEIKQQKVIENVSTYIDKNDSILGLNLSNKSDKNDLVNYIFKPMSNGMSQYQLDYFGDVKNLVESALLIKRKEDIYKTLKKKEDKNDIYREFRKKIKGNNKIKSNTNSGGKSTNLFNLIGKSL